MATQAVYDKRGTSVTFTNTGGDKEMVARALGTTTGILSAFADRGADAAPGWYEVRAYTAWQANPATTDIMRVAVFQSDGTHSDAGVAYNASADAALTVAQIGAATKVCQPIAAHTADTGEKGSTSLIWITSRYYAVGVYNASATKATADSDGTTAVVVTPVYPDIQAAA
jgi:hypothetical protein